MALTPIKFSALTDAALPLAPALKIPLVIPGAPNVNRKSARIDQIRATSMQTIATDANFSLTVNTSPIDTLHTGTLTANRAITLAGTPYQGARFRVTRTGGGAFNLDLGGLIDLHTNDWAEVVYDGAAWYLAAVGSLTGAVDFESGTWTPALGGTATGDLSGASGITVDYAHYEKQGSLVTLHFAFTVDGLTQTTFTQKSALTITGLPFSPRTIATPPPFEFGGLSGFVYQSIGSSLTSLLGGGVTDSVVAMFVFFTGSGEARNDDPFYVTVSYLTDE